MNARITLLVVALLSFATFGFVGRASAQGCTTVMQSDYDTYLDAADDAHVPNLPWSAPRIRRVDHTKLACCESGGCGVASGGVVPRSGTEPADAASCRA
jgi:hypothetical protein